MDLLHKNLFEKEIYKLKELKHSLQVNLLDMSADQVVQHRKQIEKVDKLNNEALQLAVHRDDIKIKIE